MEWHRRPRGQTDHLGVARRLAASPELTVTGGLRDGRKLHLHQESFDIAVEGPDEVRRMTRLCLRESIDTIKLNISGDTGAESAPSEATVMTAHDWSPVAAHARASAAVKRALRHGVDVICHCDYADSEALDLLEAAKDRIFTGPAVGLVLACLESLRADNRQSSGHQRATRTLRDPFWILAQRPTAGGEIMQRGHGLGLVKEAISPICCWSTATR